MPFSTKVKQSLKDVEVYYSINPQSKDEGSIFDLDYSNPDNNTFKIPAEKREIKLIFKFY